MHTTFTLMLSFFIILFVITQTSHGLNKFGCEFHNDDYGYQIASLWKPQYGAPVKPMKLKSTDDLNAIVAQMAVINKEVMRDFFYNELDDYLLLYQAYNKSMNSIHNQTEFETFLWNYPMTLTRSNLSEQHVSFSKPYGADIEILNKLIARIKDVKDHVYIGAAADVGPLNNVVENFIPDFTVAVLKFEISKTTSPGRLGYVVANPGLGLSHPIIVMEDGGSPNSITGQYNCINQYQSAMLTYRLSDSSTNHRQLLIAEQFKKNPLCPCIILGYYRFTYFLEQPLCSFVETIGKLKFLTQKSIHLEKQKESGHLRADIEFKFKLLDTKIRNDLVWNLAEDNHNGFAGGLMPIGEFNKLPEKLLSEFKIKPNDLSAKIKDLQVVIEDTDFFNYIRTLSEKVKQNKNKIIEQENKNEANFYKVEDKPCTHLAPKRHRVGNVSKNLNIVI